MKKKNKKTELLQKIELIERINLSRESNIDIVFNLMFNQNSFTIIREVCILERERKKLYALDKIDKFS